MEDFYEMTKPIKHRGLKMIKQYISYLTDSVINSAKYKYCNILSNLNIYKRETFKDSTSSISPFPVPKTLIGDRDFKVNLSAVFTTITEVDRDYFRNSKGGIEFVVKDEERSYLQAEFFVDDVFIKMGDSYNLIASGLPYVKVLEYFNPPQAFNQSFFTTEEPVNINTITLDVTKIRGLSLKVMLGTERSVDSVSEAERNYHYECACDKMREYINRLTKKDLEV